ncbi:hypothetical protein EW145_g7074 [Phellinidium pouzarii]|uniref:Uncharacterized protein n=1 Tax=Phellinidium pouzarii TaxID=167371 RepID=A0A4S4KPF2_9AGAM|nr:hypothetical protein EW145_g7074 [Phellinidium pouzarii]
MFYYLHLTRPPPEQAHPTQPLPITPNIANDLRTEFPAAIEGGIDIYYAWVKSAAVTESQNSDSSGPKASSGSSTVSRALGPMTHPLKLITWMGNSYKEVLVFPPKDVHEGQSWQILLCTKPAHLGKFTTSIDLASSSEAEDGAASFGAHVLPILSAPILFSSRRKLTAGKTLTDKKQVQNERILKFPPLWGTAVGPLRITEHLSYDLDKVWIGIRRGF